MLGAVAAGRALRGLLYGVSTSDPTALLGTVGLLVAAVAAASLPSVLWTARLDPSAVLREE